MKRSIYSLLGISLMSMAFTACYDDLGNYDYKDINELQVDSIHASYVRDVDDSLHIVPVLQGTQYSDTSRFTYKWEFNNSVLAETPELHIRVELTPGEKRCRYIVKDKNTGIQYYTPFSLSVRSSTAADLIVVLSKYQGRAELSYLRLDKPSAWVSNYYADRWGEALGTNPQQLLPTYAETNLGTPVTCPRGRLLILCDDRAALFDKSTMEQDTVSPYLTVDPYNGMPPGRPKTMRRPKITRPNT